MRPAKDHQFYLRIMCSRMLNLKPKTEHPLMLLVLVKVV